VRDAGVGRAADVRTTKRESLYRFGGLTEMAPQGHRISIP